MRAAAVLLLLTTLAAEPAAASEGLKGLVVYLSDAMSLTEAMVRACTSRHPDLAARAATALESWRQRNAADAKRAAELAARELQKLPMSAEERARTLAQAKQEHLEGWQRVAAFPTACSDYVASLERPESDLERLLPRVTEAAPAAAQP